VFGSRANGIARRSSDLDLAIFSPEATPAEWVEPQICQELLTDPFRPFGWERRLCSRTQLSWRTSRRRSDF